MMTPARWLLARATLRDYVRHTLYADLPLGVAKPPLWLPRLDGKPTLSDEDIYAARRGADDATVNDAGEPVRTSGIGATIADPTGEQAGSVAGWRAYAERELAGEGGELAPQLRFEHETVVREVARTGSRYWRSLYDLGHRANVKKLAFTRGCSASAVRAEGRQALDALLQQLYRMSAPKRAS